MTAMIGVDVARKLLRDAFRMRGSSFLELLPGPLFSSSTLMRTHLEMYSGSYYHACGTCKMSSKQGEGVVDEALQVKGVKGLRVADASVFPRIPSCPIAAICMAVGLRAADLITRNIS